METGLVHPSTSLVEEHIQEVDHISKGGCNHEHQLWICTLGAQASIQCWHGFLNNHNGSFHKGWRSLLNNSRSTSPCRGAHVKKWHMHFYFISRNKGVWKLLLCFDLPSYILYMIGYKIYSNLFCKLHFRTVDCVIY